MRLFLPGRRPRARGGKGLRLTCGLLVACAFSADLAHAEQLILRWRDNSNDELGFRIERATSDGVFAAVATVEANVVTYTDATVLADVTYLYRVRAYNQSGESAPTNIAANRLEAPAFTGHPAEAMTVGIGATASFTVAVTGSLPPTIQWQVSSNAGATWTNLANSTTYSGVNEPTLVIPAAATGLNNFRYRAVATNSAGTATSNAATLLVSSARLANLSVRSPAGTGTETLIVGFVVGGTGEKALLIRAVGPSLAPFGIASPLPDPVLSLFAGERLLESNDDWRSAANAGQIPALTSRLGAFALADTSRDAVLLTTQPSGTLTAQITGKAGATGIALVEIYDADTTATTRLLNLSARTVVGGETDTAIIGFVVTGQGSAQVLVRAIGPSLSSFGISGALADPQVAVFREGTAAALQSNDNWGGTAALRAAQATTGAFPLPENSRDAGLLLALAPGSYTAQISGVGGAAGVVLIEVYDVR